MLLWLSLPGVVARGSTRSAPALLLSLHLLHLVTPAKQPASGLASSVQRALPRAMLNPPSYHSLTFTHVQLREDLGRLPDSATDAQYEDVPVEAFGEAMLRGMGWTEGMGLGRKVIEVGSSSLPG